MSNPSLEEKVAKLEKRLLILTALFILCLGGSSLNHFLYLHRVCSYDGPSLAPEKVVTIRESSKVISLNWNENGGNGQGFWELVVETSNHQILSLRNNVAGDYLTAEDMERAKKNLFLDVCFEDGKWKIGTPHVWRTEDLNEGWNLSKNK